VVEELRWQATMVLMITRGYYGNGGYAGYDGTICNEGDTSGRE